MLGILPRLNIDVSPTDTKNLDKSKKINKMSRFKGMNYFVDDNTNVNIPSTDSEIYTIMKKLKIERKIQFIDYINIGDK